MTSRRRQARKLRGADGVKPSRVIAQEKRAAKKRVEKKKAEKKGKSRLGFKKAAS